MKKPNYKRSTKPFSQRKVTNLVLTNYCKNNDVVNTAIDKEKLISGQFDLAEGTICASISYDLKKIRFMYGQQRPDVQKEKRVSGMIYPNGIILTREAFLSKYGKLAAEMTEKIRNPEEIDHVVTVRCRNKKGQNELLVMPFNKDDFVIHKQDGRWKWKGHRSGSGIPEFLS